MMEIFRKSRVRLSLVVPVIALMAAARPGAARCEEPGAGSASGILAAADSVLVTAAEHEARFELPAAADTTPRTRVDTAPAFEGRGVRHFSDWLAARIADPKTLKKRKEELLLVVEATIDAEGAVRQLKVVQIPDARLAEGVRQAFRSTPVPRWSPALVGGERVAVKVAVPLVYDPVSRRMLTSRERHEGSSTACRYSVTLDEYDRTALPAGQPVRTAEELPRFGEGGAEAFIAWMKAHAGIGSGRYLFRFTVETDGSVARWSNVWDPAGERVESGFDALLAAMPRWTPARNGGEPVRFEAIIPVDFGAEGTAECAALLSGTYSVELEMPRFQGGGIESFRKWFVSRVGAPHGLAAEGIHGRTIVRFVVERDGSVGRIEEVLSLDPRLTESAVRALSRAPKWEPGRLEGRPVAFSFRLPVFF